MTIFGEDLGAESLLVGLVVGHQVEGAGRRAAEVGRRGRAQEEAGVAAVAAAAQDLVVPAGKRGELNQKRIAGVLSLAVDPPTAVIC
jgi:hypothetical protein